MSEIDAAQALSAARFTVEKEAAALHALAAALDGPLGAVFVAACRLVAGAPGRVIVTGMGKSGHIARKIAATLASTGRPAQFVHPAEASHGDLGMITAADCVLALSRSGETRELEDLLHHCRRLRIPLVALTFRADSTLARAADAALVMPDLGEASDAAPAPTTSTTMTLALGDALAVALLDAAGFDADRFAAIHPGGKLGAVLKRVRDVMRQGEALPLTGPGTPVPEALAVMTAGGIGSIGIVEDGRLIGIVTDGDLRRRLNAAAFSGPVHALMTPSPKTIAPDAPLADAVAILSERKLTALFVVDPQGRPLGVVHMHDLLAAGVR